jgi:putative transcriptional regulator
MSAHPHFLNRFGYLHDTLLVATPLVNDGCFDKTVVYVVAHNEQGAMGLIVNRPLKSLEISQLLLELKIPFGTKAPNIPVQFGGPVEHNRGYILHNAEPAPNEDAIVHETGIAVTATTDMLRRMVEGTAPSKCLLAFGCAAWGAKQLERELQEGSWLVVPATHTLVFDVPLDMKWAMATASLGFDVSRLSATVGHA